MIDFVSVMNLISIQWLKSPEPLCNAVAEKCLGKSVIIMYMFLEYYWNINLWYFHHALCF